MCSDFGKDGRFELYSIIFEKLSNNRRRDLKTITLDTPDGRQVIYERDEGEGIPIGKPLSLIGPSPPFLPYDPIHLVFADFHKSQWRWSLYYDQEVKDGYVNGVIKQYVRDTDSDSRAVICYDLLTNAVDATLRFRFFDNDKRRLFLVVTQGQISVVTGKSSCTKRVLRYFGGSETSLCKKRLRFLQNGNEEQIRHGQPIILDRPEFGLPATFSFQLTVKMNFFFAPLRGIQKQLMSGEICETATFHAPTAPGSTFHEFPLFAPTVTGPKLLLEVIWSDDVQTSSMNDLLAVLNKYPDLVRLVEPDTDSDSVSVASTHSSSGESVGGLNEDSSSIKGSPIVGEEVPPSSSVEGSLKVKEESSPSSSIKGSPKVREETPPSSSEQSPGQKKKQKKKQKKRRHRPRTGKS